MRRKAIGSFTVWLIAWGKPNCLSQARLGSQLRFDWSKDLLQAHDFVGEFSSCLVEDLSCLLTRQRPPPFLAM